MSIIIALLWVIGLLPWVIGIWEACKDKNPVGKKLITGWTPLHVATGMGQVKTALSLIKSGADIEAKDSTGATPLHYAAGEGQTETAAVLVRAGASLYMHDDEGKIPLDIAIKCNGKDSKIAHILRESME